MERSPSEHAILNMKAPSHTFRNLCQLSLSTILLLVTRPSFGQGISSNKISDPVAPTGPWKRAKFLVPKTTTPPVIDGKLDDSCWKTAFHAQGFFRWQTSDPTPEQSELWICADDKNLYFAVHCQDSHPELIRAEQTQREGNVNSDDTVMIFLDTLLNRRGVSQFTLSAGGVQVTQLEGGAADNHKYAGDWKGASARVTDGWTAEMAIPFSLLRHSKNADSFGFICLRSIPKRESVPTYWPHLPNEAFAGNSAVFFSDITGFHAPSVQAKPIFLPYLLGVDRSLKMGLDVKYPLTSGLNAHASLFPDFQTVEQAVTDLSFSYTAKYVPDHRPFFAEGSDLTPDPFWFYSQTISHVDEGFKVAGKEGPNTLDILGTSTSSYDHQKAGLISFDHSFGPYASLGTILLHDQADGSPQNNVGQIRGSYGWRNGGRTTRISGDYANATLAGQGVGTNGFLQVRSNAGPRRLGFNAFYSSTSDNFVNLLGLPNETDRAGEFFGGYIFDNPTKHGLEYDELDFSAETYRHLSGGFFRNSYDVSLSAGWRNGWSGTIEGNRGHRSEADTTSNLINRFVDDTAIANVGWNQKSLYESGGLTYQNGHREGLGYTFVAVNQGLQISKHASVNLGVNESTLGGAHQTQTILSGNYRAHRDSSFGFRMIQLGKENNLSISFGKRGADGTDFFVLFGDPNSTTSKRTISIKVAKPF